MTAEIVGGEKYNVKSNVELPEISIVSPDGGRLLFATDEITAFVDAVVIGDIVYTKCNNGVLKEGQSALVVGTKIEFLIAGRDGFMIGQRKIRSGENSVKFGNVEFAPRKG